MASPFPGMDPYLEQSTFWSSFHTRFLVAIADALDAQLFPKYYVDVEMRIEKFVNRVGRPAQRASPPCFKPTLMYWGDQKGRYLEIREVGSNETVTVIELLSPKNKQAGAGRKAYLRKRQTILASLTHLVEIDLLRSNRPMPWAGGTLKDYHIVVSRSDQRPEANLYSFSIQETLPAIVVPLKFEEKVDLDLQAVFVGVMARAHYDLRIDYTQPVPPPQLSPESQAWLDRQLS